MSKKAKSRLKKLLIGSSLVFVGNLVGVGASLAMRVVAANHLGPTNYGLIVLGWSIINPLAVLILLGFPAALGQRLPRVDNESNLFIETALISISLSIVVTAFLILYSESVVDIMNNPGFDRVFEGFVIVLPFLVGVRLIVGGFRGMEDATGRLVVQNFGLQGLTAILVIAAVIAGLPPLGLAIAWTGAIALTAIGGLAFLHRRTGIPDLGHFRPFSDLNRTYSLLRFSIPLVLSSGVILMLRYGDNVLLGYYTSSEAVGVYDTAYTLGRMLTLVIGAFKFLFVPMFSDLHNQDNPDEMGQLYRTVTKWIVFATTPVFLTFFLFPEFSLKFVFNESFTTGALPLMVLSTGFFIHSTMGLNAGALVAMGQSKLVLLGNVIALVGNVVLNIALIPQLGIIGAAVASVVAYIIMNAFYHYFLGIYGRLNPFPTSILAPLSISATLFAIPSTIIKTFLTPTLPIIVLLVLVFLLFYTVIILRWGIDARDKEIILTIFDNSPIPNKFVQGVFDRFC
ncbi:flippase [Halorubrum sp. SS5]|nr:flippase [Halorubrum sp. SS5]